MGVRGESASREGWSAPLALLCAGTFFYWLALYVYVPVLAVYAQSRGASLAMAGLVVSVYGVAQFFARVPVGFASDVLGRRKGFVLVGLAAAGAGSLGLGLLPDPWLMVGSRAVVGLGAAMWVAFTVLFAGYFAPERTAQAMGLLGFFTGLGQAASGLVGGYLAGSLGRESTFYAGLAAALLGLALAAAAPERARSARAGMSPRRLGRLARGPRLALTSGLALVSFWGYYTTTQSFTPIYARRLAASDGELGLLWTLGAVAAMLGALGMSRLAGWLGERRATVALLLVQGAGTALTPLAASFAGLALLQVVANVGRGALYPLLMGLSIRGLPSEERASAMGIFQAVYSIGVFAGPPLGGAVAELVGLWSVFVLTGALCGLAAGWAARARTAW